jgi:hypothetical protein
MIAEVMAITAHQIYQGIRWEADGWNEDRRLGCAVNVAMEFFYYHPTGGGEASGGNERKRQQS